MFYNEEDTFVEVEKDTQIARVDDTYAEDVDLDYSEISPANQTSQEDTIHEDIDLDYDEISPSNQTSQDDTIHEDIDLDYDEISPSNQTSQDDTIHEDIDLDYDEISPSNQTTPDDEEYEDFEPEILESVNPISFSESNVRIFQREDTNLIMESDFDAVMSYYNYNLSESEVVEVIANAHNISEDSIQILISEGKNASSTVKKVKSKISSIDMQIKNLLKMKKNKTPEQWKASGLEEKLKKLRAQKVLKN